MVLLSNPYIPFSSVTQSCATLCDSMNHSTPGLPVHHQLPLYTNSYPLSPWCHPTISSSVVPFSSCLQSFPASGSFQMSSSHEVAKVFKFQLQHQSFQWTPRTDLYNVLVGSPCSPRDSQEYSPISQFKNISSLVLTFLYSPTLTSIHHYWKNHCLD